MPNVAFEIKDDVSAGRYLSQSISCYLSGPDVAAISELVESLNNISSDVVSFANSKEVSLEKMKDASWVPLRIEANKLLLLLTPARARNRQYFQGSTDAL